MSSPTEALTDIAPARADASAGLRKTRPFLWSVRREIWEHRELYAAPLIAAGVVLLGVALGLGHVAHTEVIVNGDRPDIPLPKAAPQLIAAFVIFATTFVVSFFYCLGALNNERRDRSILFWKSLPVSNVTTVLSKITVPLIVVPLITFAVIAVTQAVVLGLETLFPTIHPGALRPWEQQLTLPWILKMELYLLIVTPIWYAPIWGWLLLVSAWSRRGTFLWAVMPPLALCIVERMGFGTSYLWSLLTHRLNIGGALSSSLSMPPQAVHDFVLPKPDPLGFVSDLNVWAGLLFAGLCLAGAAWLRRRREPI